MRWSRVSGLGLVLIFLGAACALAEMAESDRIRFKQVCRVKANGDVDIASDYIYSVRKYTQIRKTTVNTSMFLRTLDRVGQYFEMKDTKAEFDDGRNAVRVTYTLLGRMENHGKDWFGEILGAEEFEVISLHPDSIVLLAISQTDEGALLVGTVRLEFPPGTRNVRFDRERGGVLAEMPPPSSQPQGNVDVDVDLQVRPEIMSCFYKIYGNRKFRQLWVGRAVFRNRGTATLQDLRVRFRIPGYAEWSPWDHTPLVYPGQTVVEPYYPIFSLIVRELKSATPATVEMAWSYRTPDGRTVEDNDTRRIDILGLNEVIYSSLVAEESVSWFDLFNYGPLLGATFVSHTDPIVERFAGLAARMAGGVGASMNRESGLTFMRAVYDLMVYNQIKYQSPPGLFKRGVRQHVKFGRDVLQNRAGTCIDLAILYASTCQSGGLEPLLVMLPGHCFPIIRLPDGSLQPVEITNVSGTPTGQKIPFDAAMAMGQKEWKERLDDGTFYLVDVQKLRAQGVPTPELPDLPPSALGDWGIGAPGLRPSREGEAPAEPFKTKLPAAPPGYKSIADTSGVSTLIIPENWQVTVQGPAVAAADPQNKASLGLLIIAKLAPNLDVYLEAMVNAWKASVPEWKETAREKVQVGSVPAIHVKATGKPKATGEPVGVETVADYYLVLTEQHQLILILSCAASDQAQWGDPFKRMADSWRVGSAGFSPYSSAVRPEGRTPNEKTPPAGLKRLTEPSGLFAFTVPEGWPIQQEPGKLLATDPQGKVAASCVAVPAKFQDLAAYTDAMIAIWKQQAAGWKEVRRSAIQVSGRPGVSIEAASSHQGEAMAVDYYLALTDRHQLAFVIASPAAESAQWSDTLRRVGASWEILGAAPAPTQTPDKTPPPPAGWKRVTESQGVYSFCVPEGWQSRDSGGMIVAAAPEDDATVVLSAVRRTAREVQSLEQLAQARTAEWRQRVPNWEETSRQAVQVAGRPALLIRAIGRPNGVKTSLSYYLILTDRHQIALVLGCAVDRLPQRQEVLGQVLQSFEVR